ncbi:hypothetical protein BH24ACT5_BH24ACT5_05070 [soil metagenome]
MLADIALILVAAKLAAELCERVNVPAVVGEIVVGIVIGPSLLGWVDHSEPVTALAELGVLLLLVQVGMEMDLAELGKVGRASLGVAVIGVAAPFLLGGAAGMAFCESGNTALFVGAALTATSVGITARVFGDLKALAITEARIVLGAAVADDVLGLIILTVVVKIVSGGNVDAGAIAGTVGGAIGFVVVAIIVGSMAAPMVFGYVTRVSRSSATIVVLAFAFMLAVAWAAAEANLASIIGAFIAGIAIGRTRQHARVERDFGSIANVLIPVFFVQIGIDADLAAMARPAVLGLAGALLVAAIVGKVAAAGGAAGLRVDKLLIGVGMLPRGEVGIIFASIGLAEGVLGDDQYAALLIVVLVTTLMTPPLLRWRIAGVRATAASAGEVVVVVVDAASGSGGWDVAVVADRIVLRGSPSPVHTIPIALEVARLAMGATPDTSVVDWFGAHTAVPLQWRPSDTDGLIDVLRHGDARSLRFLDVTGVLDRALPEVGEALAHRRADPGELDPTRVLQLPTVQQVASTADRTALLGALVIDVCVTGAPDCASNLARRLDPERGGAIADVVEGATMLDRALTNPGVLAEASILQLAHHLGRREVVADAHALAVARLDVDDWRRAELDEMRDRIVTALSHPELLDGDATLLGTRRQAALAVLGPGADDARRRIENASASFLVSHEPAELARQATLAGLRPGRSAVRIAVDELPDPGRGGVTVSCRDRPGLLARLSDALAASDLDVVSATLTTWPDGGVVDSFVVRCDERPDARGVAERMERRLKGRIDLTSLADVAVSFDDDALPWHTVCTVRGPDRPRLLAATSAALAAAKVDVHAATVGPGPDGHEVENRFQVTDRHGRKLDAAMRDAVRRAFGRAT